MSEPEWKEYQTSPQMDLFFKRLSDIKAQLKIAAEGHLDPVTKDFALVIYQQLHELYKTSDD